MKTLIPHAAWAAVAAAVYFAGTARDSASEAEDVANDQSRIPSQATKSTPTPSGRNDISLPSALPPSSKDATVQNLSTPEETIEFAEEIYEQITDADDVLAALSHLTNEERAAAGKGLLLGMISDEDEAMMRSIFRQGLFGIGEHSLDRMFSWAVASELLRSRDADARIAAANELGLSDEELASIETRSLRSREKRNAQNLASVYSAAVAAGADFSSATNAREIADQLTNGIYGGAEQGFGTTMFKVPIDDPTELEAALSHLADDFSYRPERGG